MRSYDAMTSCLERNFYGRLASLEGKEASSEILFSIAVLEEVVSYTISQNFIVVKILRAKTS